MKDRSCADSILVLGRLGMEGQSGAKGGLKRLMAERHGRGGKSSRKHAKYFSRIFTKRRKNAQKRTKTRRNILAEYSKKSRAIKEQNIQKRGEKRESHPRQKGACRGIIEGALKWHGGGGTGNT